MKNQSLRTALDTTIYLESNFNLTHLKMGQIDWTAQALNAANFLRDNSSERFWLEFKRIIESTNHHILNISNQEVEK